MCVCQGEGTTEVGRARGFEFGQGGVQRLRVVRRGGGEQQARPPVEGDQRQGFHIAAGGGQLSEEASSSHAELLGIGRAHAVRIVEQQRDIHAPGLAMKSWGKPDDGGRRSVTACDDQVECTVQAGRPTADVEYPAGFFPARNDHARLKEWGVNRRVGRDKPDGPAGRRAAFTVCDSDEASVPPDRQIVCRLQQAGHQAGRRQHPEVALARDRHDGYSSVCSVATETLRAPVRSQRLSTLTKSAWRARRSQRIIVASSALR